MKLGLYDTQDNVWLGNDTGPITYPVESAEIARMAARMATKQLGWAPGRVEAREIPEEAWRKRDEAEILMTPEEALRQLEKGL